MKPTKIILCLEACVGLAVVSLAGNLAVPPEGVDFGEIAAGTNSEMSVSVRNIGNRDIHISRVKPCCGAEAALSKMILKSNETAELTVRLAPTIRALQEKYDEETEHGVVPEKQDEWEKKYE